MNLSIIGDPERRSVNMFEPARSCKIWQPFVALTRNPHRDKVLAHEEILPVTTRNTRRHSRPPGNLEFGYLDSTCLVAHVRVYNYAHPPTIPGKLAESRVQSRVRF